MRYACCAPDGSGAAEPFEPCQVREEAAVRRIFRVPPGNLSGALVKKNEWRIKPLVFFVIGFNLSEQLDRSRATVLTLGIELYEGISGTTDLYVITDDLALVSIHIACT